MHAAKRCGRSFVGLALGLGLLLGSSLLSPMAAQGQPKASSSTGNNLLTGDQATFGSSTGGWKGLGASLSWSSTVGANDPGALDMTPAGSAPVWGSGQSISAWSSWPPSGGPGLTAAQPGRVYEGTAQVAPTDATDRVDVALVFWSSTGAGLLLEPSTVDTIGSGSWTPATTVSAVAPPGTAFVTLGVMEWGTTGTGGLYVDDAYLTSVNDTPASVVGPLRTQGTRIVDGSGTPLTLRGISYIGLATSAQPPDLTEQTFADLHGWGASMVRFFINEEYWDPQSCAYLPGYQSAVEQAVSWTTSLGMVALLTLEGSVPQDINASGACATQGVQNMADNPGSDYFWSSAATIFKANPLVAFDLWNEPNGINDSTWLNGGPQNGFVGQGMQELYNDVRNSGATNLVFAQGNNWGSTPPPADDLIQGYNVVYDVHFYTCPQAAPPNCSYSGNPYDPSAGLDPWVSFQSEEGVPVFVGEFGWPSSSDGTYVANVIKFADGNGWGWSAYTYDPWTGDNFDLISSARPAWPFEPSPAGMPVLADMAAASQ